MRESSTSGTPLTPNSSRGPLKPAPDVAYPSGWLGRFQTLGEKKQDLVELLGKGWKDKDAARELGLTVGTVRQYKKEIAADLPGVGGAGDKVKRLWAVACGASTDVDPRELPGVSRW